MVAQQSPAARIRVLVKEKIEGVDEVELSDLTDQMVAVLNADDTFLLEFARSQLRAAVYEQVRTVVGWTRDLILTGDVAMTKEARDRKAAHFADRFLSWLEHSGDRHIQVMEMTTPDLLAAAEERRTSAEHHHAIADLWVKLAGSLEPPTQQVKDRFTAPEIEAMYQDIILRRKGS